MTEKLTAIIVDDETIARETLYGYVQKYCPQVDVVALCDSIAPAYDAIVEHDPDIVFLDVEMPFGNAFDLLEKFKDISFEIVFVTAFSDYAIKALNFSASYYILKPIDIDELVAAVDKIADQRGTDNAQLHTKVLIDNLHDLKKQRHKIVLPLMEGFEVVKVSEVIRCQANDNFTDIHLLHGRKLMICRTLKFYENLLIEFRFVRVHKSHLINIDYVKRYLKGKGGQVVMEDDSVVDVSPNRKKELLAYF